MNAPAARHRQFSLRFLFLLTALSAGQVVMMRLLAEWHFWFLQYIFLVAFGFGFAFSKDRSGPGSLFYSMLWTAAAIAVGWLGLLHDGWKAEQRWGLPVVAAWYAFWGDVLGGVAAWCWRSMARVLERSLRRRPRRSDQEQSM